MKEKFEHTMFILAIILLSSIFIAGCTQAPNGSGQPISGVSPSVTPASALANPAAVFCEEKNYQYVIRKNPDGSEYGVCIFPDRTECEEWAFYQGTCNESTAK